YNISLLRQYLSDDSEFTISTKPVVSQQINPLQLSDNLTCLELARRTPGYEIGDLIRLVAHLKMACLTNDNGSDDDDDDNNANGQEIPVKFAPDLCIDDSVENNILS
ncbi:unnamed protein product, partial [Trichobilharzia regenti]